MFFSYIHLLPLTLLTRQTFGRRIMIYMYKINDQSCQHFLQLFSNFRDSLKVKIVDGFVLPPVQIVYKLYIRKG
jgi:hypothetical protein